MYKVEIGTENTYITNSVKEAFELAIMAFKLGGECQVVSEETGEIILMLYDNQAPYISNDIVYAVW